MVSQAHIVYNYITCFNNLVAKFAGHSAIPLDTKNIADLVITNMAFKWYLMGVELGVDQNELNNIKHDCQDSKTACLMMFTEWLNNTGGEKSWNTLLGALHSQFVGESCLASDLFKKLTQYVP